MIVVLPSFDYEIFHGRNFADAEATLFDPAARMLAEAAIRGIAFTLFADVCSVWAHREHGLNAFADRFETQLCEAHRAGHDVQLHLHAHWLSAKFDGDAWTLREPRITLADYDFETGVPQRTIAHGIDYLQALLRAEDPAYRCTAFRAGALALGPQESALISALLGHGIALDSSVAPGYVCDTGAFNVDYRGAPRRANWSIAPASGPTATAEAGLFEIPIATFRMNAVERLRFLTRRVSAVRRRRGLPISRTKRQARLSGLAALARQNLRYLTGDPVFLFSADTKGLTAEMLVNGFERYVNERADRGGTPMYVSMMNHPKLIFAEQERLLFEVLERLRDRFGGRLTFATFADVERAQRGCVPVDA
jgi:hypothetical protein